MRLHSPATVAVSTAFRRALVLAGMFMAATATAEIRMWHDRQGRGGEGEFVSTDGRSVVIRLTDDSLVTYPIANLSDPDRAWLAAHTKRPTPTPPAVPAPVPGFDSPWPERIKFDGDPEITVVEENPDTKSFIYTSANYRYVCDVRLSKSVVKGFAVMFETTRLYCHTLPLGFALNGGNKGGAAEGKFDIRLFEKFDDYVKAGGPPKSAGVFIGGKGHVLVPLTSLGVRKMGSGYILDRDKTNKTLPHELTHQLTPPPYFNHGAGGWFTEGIAEYVAVTPYRGGSYNVRSNRDDIVAFVTEHGKKGDGGRGIGDEISLPSLEEFMTMDYSIFLANPQVNYGTSLLLTYYYCHLDGKGDGANLKAFLKALREGKKGKEAIALLLAGRSFEQMEKEITKAWKRKGIEFKFGAASLPSHGD